MEKIGVSVGIIIDNTDEYIHNVIMKDDGTGNAIRIPSMLISKSDGKKLLDYLKRATDDELDQIAIMAEFVMKKPDNRVEYDIWYTSSNDKALDFIQDFSEYDSKFGEKVLMEPRFVFWTCKDCDDKYLQKDCYGGGAYCAYESSNEKLSGREIIQEDLREKCLYKETYKQTKTRHLFWSYIKQVHVNCYNVINHECS
jgi:hypothetical protein